MLVIDPGYHGEPGHIPFSVVHDRMDIRRKNGLGIIIYRNSGIGPPEKRLGHIGAVV